MRAYWTVAFLAGCLAPATAHAITPVNMCKKAGFDSASPFKEECVKRVFKERRSNFWHENGAMIAAGAIAGVAAAATGGSAFAIVGGKSREGVHRVDLEGQSFLVQVKQAGEATVRSKVRYKNVGRKDEPTWARAAELASGCTATRPVRDFDALYVWLDCGTNSGAATSIPLDAVRAPSGSVGGATPFVADELTKLAELFAKGLLTRSEFEAQKVKLLRDN